MAPPAQLRDPERFDAWLYRILVMACYAEANHRRAVHDAGYRPIEAAHERDIGATLADNDALERAFLSLTPAHRAVVVLHYVVGLPLTEVARIVGVSHGDRALAPALRAAGDADGPRGDRSRRPWKAPDGRPTTATGPTRGW